MPDKITTERPSARQLVEERLQLPSSRTPSARLRNGNCAATAGELRRAVTAVGRGEHLRLAVA